MYRKIKSACEYAVYAVVISAFVFHLNSTITGDAHAQENTQQKQNTQPKLETVQDTIKQSVDSIYQKTR